MRGLRDNRSLKTLQVAMLEGEENAKVLGHFVPECYILVSLVLNVVSSLSYDVLLL